MNTMQCVLGALAIGVVMYVSVTFAQEKSENETFQQVCKFKLPIIAVLCVGLFFLANKMLPKSV